MPGDDAIIADLTSLPCKVVVGSSTSKIRIDITFRKPHSRYILPVQWDLYFNVTFIGGHFKVISMVLPPNKLCVYDLYTRG
jgi:hypothetical protein